MIFKINTKEMAQKAVDRFVQSGGQLVDIIEKLLDQAIESSEQRVEWLRGDMIEANAAWGRLFGRVMVLEERNHKLEAVAQAARGWLDDRVTKEDLIDALFELDRP